MEKITKAMKMVAAARLRKCQERVVAARPYTRQMHEILARLAQNQEEATHPLLENEPCKQWDMWSLPLIGDFAVAIMRT